MLAVTGDTHREEGRFIYRNMGFEKLGEGDFLCVTGDFGYVWDDSFGERKYRKMMAEKPYTICFVDGNHENFDLLEQYPVEMWKGGKVHVIERDLRGKPKIIHLMRGQVYEIEGKKVFTFGGGYSIDVDYRRPHVSWWPQEMPTDDERVEAIRNLEKHGNKVDFILTHAAPENIMYRFHRYHESEKPLNNFLQWVRENVQYQHWYMGHLHSDLDVDEKLTILLFDVRNMETNESLSDE